MFGSKGRELKAMVVVALLITGAVWADTRFVIDPGGTRRQAAFDKLDLSPLEEEFRRYHINVSKEELVYRVQNSFHFVFFNKLDSSKFLYSPTPVEVAGKITSLFELNRKMKTLLPEGRRLAVEGSLVQRRLFLNRLLDCAKRIDSTFTGFFLDIGEGSLRFHIPAVDDEKIRFIHCLLQVEKLNNRLTGALISYFMEDTPGVVALSDYQETPVRVLTQSLVKLIELTRPASHWK